MLYIPLVTQVCKRTLAAFRGTGGTGVPPKQNDPVAEIAAFIRGKDGAKLCFHLFRVSSGGKAKTAADADAVGVADHAARCAENITQEQIGSFPPHAGQL